jgi:hypothetical protein
VNSMSTRALPHFFGCEVSSCRKQGCVEHHDDGHILECAGGSLGRSTVCREDKPIPRASIYSSEDKMLPQHDRSGTM